MGTGEREEVKRGANRFTFFKLIIGSLRFRVSLILSYASSPPSLAFFHGTVEIE